MYANSMATKFSTIEFVVGKRRRNNCVTTSTIFFVQLWEAQHLLLHFLATVLNNAVHLHTAPTDGSSKRRIFCLTNSSRAQRMQAGGQSHYESP
jgi:hypothetical protein